MRLFRKRFPVELAVITILKDAMPFAMQKFHAENEQLPQPVTLSEATFHDIFAAMALFYLTGKCATPNVRDTDIMQRAFEAMWQYLPQFGGNADKTNQWFQIFNSQLVEAHHQDRVKMVADAMTEQLRLPTPVAGEFALWFFAFIVHSGLSTVDNFKLT